MNNLLTTPVPVPVPGPPTLKQLPPGERPRERLLEHGAERLTDAELVGLLLGSGVRGATAVDVGRRLVAAYGNVRGLARAAPPELAAHHGVGPARAARLAAGIELGRRLAAAPLLKGVRIDRPEAVRDHFGPLLADVRRERLYAVLLDRRSRVIRAHLLSEGSVGEAAAQPRDVFLPAIREHASAVVLVHNHPSGDPAPSADDFAVTRRIAEAGTLLGIPLLDHVVVAGTEWASAR